MTIEKYGTTDCFGYGVLYDSDCPYFQTDIYVFAESSIATESFKRIEGFPTSIRSVSLNIGPYGSGKLQPVYVVFEGETKTWREYFSGLTVDLTTDCYLRSSSFHDYNVDNEIKHICRTLSVYGIQECNATVFSNKISVYTEEQIQEMVNQIYEINGQAKKWSDALDRTIQAVMDERKRRESGVPGIESTLSSGFGAYGSTLENTATNSAQSESAPKTFPTEKEMLNWIRQGRCTYCGGEFKGIFSKSCRVCGKPKDYR